MIQSTIEVAVFPVRVKGELFLNSGTVVTYLNGISYTFTWTGQKITVL